MLLPDDIYAKPKQHILPKWRKLLAWAKQFDLYAGSDVRLHVTPNGTWISIPNNDKTWLHPFRVSLSGLAVRVRYGTVTSELGDQLPDVPRIGELRLDGTDMDYKPTGESLPVLNLDPPGDSVVRSLVTVRITLTAEESIDPTDPQALQIVHRIPAADEVTDPAVHYEPLAVLYWQGERVIRSRPVVHHNLKHYYRPAEGDRPGRHYCGGV